MLSIGTSDEDGITLPDIEEYNLQLAILCARKRRQQQGDGKQITAKPETGALDDNLPFPFDELLQLSWLLLQPAKKLKFGNSGAFGTWLFRSQIA
jgi:hypothetical protein